MLRYQKKIAFFIVTVFFISIALTSSACSACSAGDNLNVTIGMANPAAIYCVELGYGYKIITDNDGGQWGVCIFPDNSSCEEWAFFTGKCGQNYSYCKLHGCDIETLSDGKNPYSPEYAVCVLPDSKRKAPVTKLMDLNKKISAASIPLKYKSAKGSKVDRDTKHCTAELPSSFDWRDKDGENWMTSIKSQGGCGSCWAFAAVGGVEAAINIARKQSNFDVDLSEQYLVSDCFSGGGCDGGCWPGDALLYIQTDGITDEPCFPYFGADCPCEERCATWDKRLWDIEGYGGVFPFDQENIKNHLIEKGPLVVTLCWNGTWDEDDIFRCEDDLCSSENDSYHAVIITGYDDVGGYWIAKNSWGTGWWPDSPLHYSSDGYFKIGYGECQVENWALHIDLTKQPVEEVKPNMVHVVTGSKSGALNATYYKDGNYLALSESCSFPNCEGLDARINFPMQLQHDVTSIDVIAYHRARSEEGFSLYCMDENEGVWDKLGGVPDSEWYQMKYNICNSKNECNNYYSPFGALLLKYYHPSCSWCDTDHVDIDWLYLEVNTTAWVDTTPPMVTITRPENGSVVNTSYIYMQGYATDDIGVVRVCSKHESQSSLIGFCGSDFNATANVSISWAVELEEGVNTMTWTAYDEAGNSGNASVTVIYDEEKPNGPYNYVHLGDACLVLIGQELNFVGTGWSWTPVRIFGDPDDDRIAGDVYILADNHFDSSMMIKHGTYYVNLNYTDKDNSDAILYVTDAVMYLDLKVGYDSVSSITTGTPLRIDFSTNLDANDLVDLRVIDPEGQILNINPADPTQKFDDIKVSDLWEYGSMNRSKQINTTGWDIGTYTFSVRTEAEHARGLDMCSAKRTLTITPTENIFDTDPSPNPYPSIFGTHNGTIKPNQIIAVDKLYTYPCAGTGGHTEYVRIWNETLEVEAHWKGYQGEWHNISFDKSFTLVKGEAYNYTIRTGSYPQIHHNKTLTVPDGEITCTEFIDANGKRYKDWIPAIRLFLQ